ncbi:HAD family hydrolase [Alkalibacterium sp. MB6]|uniref:HAD family hydrolase n=1 Tax=Alkalibacterium sp. MB6 TaxID=2081965 RepID=UPI00137B16BB|nr:HAD family hydrolase [Alkalibacterium sp. MB6]
MENIVDNIKYVGIDLDDTLYNRDNVYKNTFYIMEKEVVCTNSHFEKFNKTFQKYSINEFDKYTTGKKSKLSYKLDRVKSAYKDFGKTISEEEALIFHSLYEYFRNNITLRPDALEFIQLLKELHVQPFILTNGPSEDQWEKIKDIR